MINKKNILSAIVTALLLFLASPLYSVESCSELETIIDCVEVTQCRDIDESGKYYLLTEDVISDDTCFSIKTGNFIFDLNQKLIKYAQNNTGYAFHMLWSNSDNITIKNGLIQGGYNYASHAIYFQTDGSDNININSMAISVSGIQSEGILLETGDGLTIRDVNIVMDSDKEDPCTHSVGHIRGIGIKGRSGKTQIYNNSITGKGMIGIAVSDCGSWDQDETMEINNNFISLWSPVRDGYAISIGGRDGACSDGIKIFDNYIDQENGRGIIVGGHDTDFDHGPGNVEIKGNNINVKEGWDCEYDSPGTATGIRLRFGANNVYTHDNYISGLAGIGVAQGSNPTRDGSTVVGIYAGSSEPYGVNNRCENNFVDVSTNDADFSAIAVYVAGGTPEHPSPLSYYKNNTIKSNNQPIRVSYVDGGGYNAIFDSNTIIKGDNEQDFKTIGLGYWTRGATGIRFLDTVFENGASMDDITFYPGGVDGNAYFDDISVSWTLKSVVKNQVNRALPGALVTIRDNSGNIISQGSTDYQGAFDAQLDEKYYEGIDGATAFELGPYTLVVSYNGETQVREVDLNEKTTETFVFNTLIIIKPKINKLTVPLIKNEVESNVVF